MQTVVKGVHKLSLLEKEMKTDLNDITYQPICQHELLFRHFINKSLNY